MVRSSTPKASQPLNKNSYTKPKEAQKKRALGKNTKKNAPKPPISETGSVLMLNG